MHARVPALLLCAAAAAAVHAAQPVDPAEAAIARWIDQPAPYVASEGETARPVALGLFGGLQTGTPKDDVSLLRIGLACEHNNVGILDFDLFYGRTHGSQRGIQLGGANVADGPLAGIQLGWVGNAAGILDDAPSTGAQIGTVANYAESLAGVQLGLGLNRNAEGSGLQIGGVANFSDRFRGIQFAIVNLDGDDIRGAQLGAINAGAKVFSGVQLGLLNGCPGEQHGLQIALLNTAGTLNGLQFGLVNMATTSRGWQIGVYNDVQHAQGVQIGLLNWASRSELPLLPLLRVSF